MAELEFKITRNFQDSYFLAMMHMNMLRSFSAKIFCKNSWTKKHFQKKTFPFSVLSSPEVVVKCIWEISPVSVCLQL